MDVYYIKYFFKTVLNSEKYFMTCSFLIFISDSQDMSIKSSKRSWDIVVLNLFLIIFSFENVLSGVLLDIGNVLAICNASYKHGKTSFKPDL